MKAQVETILLDLGGVPGGGFNRVAEGVLWAMEQPEPWSWRATKQLYPAVAARTGCNSSCAEKSMRNFIMTLWEHGDQEKLHMLFSNRKSPPRTKEFISIMAKRILVQTMQ